MSLFSSADREAKNSSLAALSSSNSSAKASRSPSSVASTCSTALASACKVLTARLLLGSALTAAMNSSVALSCFVHCPAAVALIFLRVAKSGAWWKLFRNASLQVGSGAGLSCPMASNNACIILAYVPVFSNLPTLIPTSCRNPYSKRLSKTRP